MYLKSLTLRGFKSFASATTLRLEPGITCVVGPNGSGKSNVVDALAWVMGEQGAKSLRGAKMEDVIFAGTAGSEGRPPLGRAEVALTIDNTDGALPIDYAEVTISRTMFRAGGSDYSINGTPCRLLDVQELLSDSGIGREMHVIVGQGQLDAVLRATPEERRGFIEEAAGVLKHRKRKERALRKLEAMDLNLTRVADLTTEIRRQLGPLGRQAEAARRAAVIQATARDARLRLLADDLVQLSGALEQEVAAETALIARRSEVEQDVAAAVAQQTALEAEVTAAAPELARAQDRWFAFSAMKERLAATGSLAAERVRLLAQDDGETAQVSRRDPATLLQQAQGVRDQEQVLLAQAEQAADELDQVVAQRMQAEAAYAAEQARVVALVRASADRREGLATLAGHVGSRRSRIEAGEAEVGRLRENAQLSAQRAAAAEQEFAALESSIAVDEEGEEGLDSAHDAAAVEHEQAQADRDRWREAERAADRDRSNAAARLESLELALRRDDGAAALLSSAKPINGLLGSVAALLDVEAPHETAISAALGWAADAVAVESVSVAAAAVAALRAQDAGRAGFLIGATAQTLDPSAWPALPDGARWAREVVGARAQLQPAVEQLLQRVALVADAPAALALVQHLPGVTAVTADGDVYAPGQARGGSDAAPSLIQTQAAADRARHQLQDATARGERARFALATAGERLSQATRLSEEALERLHESDARLAAVAERLGQLGALARAARGESERTEQAIAAAEGSLSRDRHELAELESRLASARQPPTEQDPSSAERDRLDAAAATARSGETEQRLALRTAQERARAMAERAAALEAAAAAELQAQHRSAARLERRGREAAVARAVTLAAAYAGVLVGRSLQAATEERTSGERMRAEREAALAALRRRVDALTEQRRELTDSVHRDEVARTQQRLRIEALQARAVDELGMDPDVLVESYGPHQLVPNAEDARTSSDGSAHQRDGSAHQADGSAHQADGVTTPDEPLAGAPYVRAAQEKRLRSAERTLAQIGRVNPLALEEYAALEERHRFLTEQLEDLKRSKKDLLEIVREVDGRVEQAFADAFRDTAAQFEHVFERLFPGGEGRLVLTDPGDMLTTGIEVEARPPGKKIKRLSLLSGGERSLTAVALLVSIFKARPSPFYIMDEVEAALDETNLGRLLTLFEELRDSSQLVVITHQKRTMEVADALYGVTMRGDGVTTVVSQRIREVQGLRSA